MLISKFPMAEELISGRGRRIKPLRDPEFVYETDIPIQKEKKYVKGERGQTNCVQKQNPNNIEPVPILHKLWSSWPVINLPLSHCNNTSVDNISQCENNILSRGFSSLSQLQLYPEDSDDLFTVAAADAQVSAGDGVF